MAEIDAWMPLWIGDYLADTQELTTEEHGAYLLLLMSAWRSGGHLPSAPDRLARIAKLNGKAWSETWKSLSRFFVSVDGEQLAQKRLARELIAASTGRSEAASRAGKASAEARKRTFGSAQPSNGRSNGTSNAVRTEPRTEPERTSNGTSNASPNGDSNVCSENRSERSSNSSDPPSESESEGGSGSGARTPPRSQPWSPDEWARKFAIAWQRKYANFYGQAGDSKACGTLGDMLERLPVDEVLRCQSRAEEMFAEFLAGTGSVAVERKHPFAFFVGDFGSLRVSKGNPNNRPASTAAERAAREWAGR